MKQTIFETKQRADELLKHAIEVWRKSDQSDKLEDIENDPVVSMLITALAYQANETESELEQMKADVLEEFAQSLTPYEAGHAIPASTVIETALSGVNEIEMDESYMFTLKEPEIGFMPLLRTRVLNVSLKSVVRLDARRWKVTLTSKSPISDLSRFCFAVKNTNFRDLSVSVKGQMLPLIKPWDFSELPVIRCFSIDAALYNRSQTFLPQSLCMDLFAWQNLRLFCVGLSHGKLNSSTGHAEAQDLELVFEFKGITDNFLFDKNNIALNAVPLVNAQLHTATLSKDNPIVRVSGYDDKTADKNIYSHQFLHTLRPADEQLYGKIPVEVRRIAADRFNQGALVKLLNNLINKYYSDFYAFQYLQDAANDMVIHRLMDILSQLQERAKRDLARSVPGVYLILRPSSKEREQNITLDVPYVTTLGAAINNLLTASATFVPPSGFDAQATRQIATPMPGADEIRDKKGEDSLRRYFMTTHERLVTPADIKAFCYHQLLTRYGIERNMVTSIAVNHRQQFYQRMSGYEILVEIVLAENPFVKRGFADKIPQTELLMQKMIEVRSANIYPVKVNIEIK